VKVKVTGAKTRLCVASFCNLQQMQHVHNELYDGAGLRGGAEKVYVSFSRVVAFDWKGNLVIIIINIIMTVINMTATAAAAVRLLLRGLQ